MRRIPLPEQTIVRRFLGDATVLSLAFSVFVIATLLWDRWLWFADYPTSVKLLVRDIQTPPLGERLVAGLFGLGGVFVTAIILARRFRFERRVGLPAVLGYCVALFAAVHLWDLLFIDWLVIATITPAFVVFPGTEGAPGYHDYMFHLRVFFSWAAWIGTIAIASVVTLAVAGLDLASRMYRARTNRPM